MAASKSTSSTTPEIPTFDAADFEAAANRVRSLNEQLIEASKQTGNVTLDAYEKTLEAMVDFEKKAADASQLDWVSTFTNAHVKFVTEMSSAYTKGARDMLK